MGRYGGVSDGGCHGDGGLLLLALASAQIYSGNSTDLATYCIFIGFKTIYRSKIIFGMSGHAG
jgi:hypothetical protein